MRYGSNKLKFLLVAICALSLLVEKAQTQQVHFPETAGQVPGPASGSVMTRDYVQAVARMAYIWGWPLVNMANRGAAFSTVPEPRLTDGVVPAAYNRLAMLTGYIAPNQRYISCLNQDTEKLNWPVQRTLRIAKKPYPFGTNTVICKQIPSPKGLLMSRAYLDGAELDERV